MYFEIILNLAKRGEDGQRPLPRICQWSQHYLIPDHTSCLVSACLKFLLSGATCQPLLDFCGLGITEVPVIDIFIHASSRVKGRGMESTKPCYVLGDSYQLEHTGDPSPPGWGHWDYCALVLSSCEAASPLCGKKYLPGDNLRCKGPSWPSYHPLVLPPVGISCLN